jgi:tetratricopeptide (TPR) repeat protein
MSLDDLINQLLDEKTPQQKRAPADAEGAVATAPSPGNGGAVDEATAAEITRLKGEMQRLMLQVKVLKAENEGLKTAAIEAQRAAPAEPVEQPFVSSAPAALPSIVTGTFPWKRHITTVEETLRRKQTDIAEAALKVLVDVAEVVEVDAPARARLLTQLGTIRLEQGNDGEAETTLNDALKLLQSGNAMNTVSAAFCLDSLAEIQSHRDDYENAEKTRRQAVTIAEEVLGAEHPDVGYFRERLELLRQNRSIAQIGSDERSKTVLTKLTEEYNAAVEAGTYQEPQHKAADGYSGLMLDKFVTNAKASLAQKNAREAESYLRSALEKAENVPDNDPRKCETFRMFGAVLEQTGKDNEAKEAYEKALIIAFKNLGWQDVQIAHCLHALADLHNKLNDFGLAKNYYKQALTAFKAAKDDENAKLLDEKMTQFVDRVKTERQWKGWSN